MSYQSVGVANERPDREYSFLESLSLSPRESFSLVSQEKLGLSQFPNTSTTSRVSVPENNPALRRTISKAPAASTTQKFSTIPTLSPVPKLPTNTKISTAPKPPAITKVPTAGKSQVQSKPSKSNMAPSSKAQSNCQELCHKSTLLGNRVSVHILEYLTTVKNLPPGFEALAHEFLDTCEILFSIEAGIGDCNENGQKLPAEMITELDSKFRVTLADFQILDQMVNKLLEHELGTMSRIKRGWGKMFGDNDLTKVRSALSRTRESLRMSALVFQWSLGSERISKEMGIGYTGLAAALDRLDRWEKKAGITAEKAVITTVKPVENTRNIDDNRSSSSTAVMDLGSPITLQPQLPQVQLQPLPPAPWPGRSSSTQQEVLPIRSQVKDVPMTPGSDFRHQYNAPTINTAHSTATHELPQLWAQARPESFERAITIVDDVQSHAGTNETDSLLNEVGGVELNASKVVRLRADPTSMPRWAPRNSVGAEAGNMRAALVSAIRSRNHKLVEQMLDRGVSPNTGPDMHALKEAIIAYDTESVRLLLLFGADPNDPDRSGVTPLFAAVEKSFLAGATTLLKYGADPNLAAGPDLESPLGAAALANRVGFSHLLLIYNGDPNHIMSNGNTLLISSIQKKTPRKYIDLLLNYGANPNAKSREGKSALFEAIQLGRSDLVLSLLEHGADPNLPGPKHMLWPSTYQSPCLKLLLDHGADHKKCPGIMELATSINNIESVRILLKAGVNPNSKKDGVYTPLCTSIRDDRAELFELLLSNGADPNTPASEYPAFKCVTHHRVHFLPALVAAGADLHIPKGILETAVKSNNMEALNWLLDQGLNPNDKNPKGASPLTTAIVEDRIEMVDLLLHRGADPNMRGQDWPVCLAVRNPPVLSRILTMLPEPRAFKGVMEMAVSANQLESVKLLLAAGVSVEDKNGGVFSPLTTALRENHREIVRFLLTEGGADVNSPGEHLPIVKALRRFHGEDTEMLELLLEHGADPNQVYRGWNGMMQAVENGDADVLRLIVKKCDVNLEVKDELGRNVVKVAESRGWTEAVEIIMGASS
ncbi:ankyrin repeat-containing domain protein [Bisporella sp. PMI_857]|nr:ankyrin repeat-containing domain protein [Bisporella sp. PMI_857]